MTMKTLNFGIEIETVGLSKERVARAMQTVVGGTARVSGRGGWEVLDARGRIWHAAPDGSLTGYENAEIVSPILSYPDIEDLQQVVRAVRAAGAKVDASCGIHIHVDGRRFRENPKHVGNLVKLVAKQEKLIEHALQIGASRARYCQPIDEAFLTKLLATRPQTLAQLSELWYGGASRARAHYDSSRYRGVNLHSLFFRGTIEFRWFDSTLHAGEVKAYVQFILALAAKALNARGASAKRREFNPATAKYDFRVFLLGLGLIGPEFKTARYHLIDHLGGSAAWKGERRDRPSAESAEQ
jgi:hypothetical protein